jgi:maltose O-acetyltransferase
MSGMSDGPQPAGERTQLERMLAGDLYSADDPELATAAQRASGLTEQFNQSRAHEKEERLRILGELLGALGEATEIRPPLYCEYGFQLLIGARTFVNFGLMALDVATITIGDDVQIGPSVQLLTPTHPIEPDLRRSKLEAALPITIGDNAWLGGGVIVLPGVSIGANTVVGAGSVVVNDLPADVVAVGNPARIVRRLE